MTIFETGLVWLIIWSCVFILTVMTIDFCKYYIHRYRKERKMTREFLLLVGDNCKAFRTLKGFTVNDVAKWSGYAPETVVGFEHGRNNNATILSWYVAQGMTFKEMTEGVKQ